MTIIRANNNNNLIGNTIGTTTGNDVALTPLNNVEVLALAGNDTIQVSDGALLANAVIRAAEGNDTISLGSAGAVNTSLFTGTGNDSITVAGALVSSQLQSLSGNNRFSVQAQTLVQMQTGVGNDTLLINGLSTLSTIRAGAGDDSIWLGAGSDHSGIFSGDGNDSVTAANASTLTATQLQDLNGNNRFNLWQLNASSLVAGSGHDTLLINGASSQSLVRLAGGNDVLVVSAQISASSLFTGAGDDTIRLDTAAANTQITSQSGNNRIEISHAALASTDLLIDSNDESILWLANDNLNRAEDFFGANNISGGINTVTNLQAGGAGAEVLLGNAAYARGIRRFVAQEGINARVRFEPTPSSAAITLIGASGNDSIWAGNGNDRIDSGAGNDSISSRDGDDTITSGEGDDISYANIGNDLVLGNSGNDDLNGGQGTDTLWGGAGDDTINGGSSGVDLINGDEGDDVVLFDNQANQLFSAGTLVDQIDGGTGANSIRLSFRDGGGTMGYTIAFTDHWSRASNIQRLETGLANFNAIEIDLNASAFTTGIRTVSLARDSNPFGENRINASLAMTGQNLSLVGSAGADAITGGAGNDTITGADGIDQLNGRVGIDQFNSVITSALDRDTVIDFMAGNGGDQLALAAANTTLATPAGVSAVVTLDTSAPAGGGGDYALTGASTANTDVIVLQSGNALGNQGNLANATDGTELLKALSTDATAYAGITAAGPGQQAYCLAYQAGNAYLYVANASGITDDTRIIAAEIALVAILNSVAANSIGTGANNTWNMAGML